MYLSKILINSAACGNPYEVHRILWRLFPEDVAARREFLFRVRYMDWNHAEVLMQSERTPDRFCTEAKILAWKKYPLYLHAGQRLRFYLVANPIKTIDDETGRKNIRGDAKKCRVPLIRNDEQRNWIERKFQDAASFEALVVDSLNPLSFCKIKEGRAWKIYPVNFQGIMNVKNPATISALVQNGIGPAKAFGCGLLSLASA
jgi:CRISPR system Cascade subunit CasE